MKDKSATRKNDWPLNLQTYVDNYNNNYHFVIKTRPNNAVNKVDQVASNIRNKSVREKLVRIHKLQEDDKVRIRIFKGKLDKASTQNFGKTIYTIHRIVKSDKPFIQPKFRLMDNVNDLIKNYYSLNDLLKVIKVTKSPVLVSVPATLKKKHIQQEIVEYKPVTRSQMKLESIAPPKKSISSRRKRPNTDVPIKE